MTDDIADKEIRSLLAQAAQLIERASSLIGASHEFPAEAARLVESGICLVCRKKIPAGQRSFRGAHEACYKRVYRSIQNGEMTDVEAVSAGLLAPERPRGGGGKVKDDRLAEYLATRDQRSPEDAKRTAAMFIEKKKELMKKSRTQSTKKPSTKTPE